MKHTAWYNNTYLRDSNFKTSFNLKNAVFWDVATRGSRKNRRFGGMYRFHYHEGE
jgi:hypothetical protein